MALVQNKKFRLFTISSIPFLPIIAFSSCSSNKMATEQEIIDGLKEINLNLEVTKDKIDLDFSVSMYSRLEYPENLEKLLKKESFLSDYNINEEKKFIPLFVTDAFMSYPYVNPTIYPPYYETRFDFYQKSIAPGNPFYKPLDITGEKNYSFLFSTLNPWNKQNTVMSIPKWYLKLISQHQNYKKEKIENKVHFFLKIKPINPYSSKHNYFIRDYINKHDQIKDNYIIPFWLIEVIYDTENDTFKAIQRDPKIQPTKWQNPKT